MKLLLLALLGIFCVQGQVVLQNQEEIDPLHLKQRFTQGKRNVTVTPTRVKANTTNDDSLPWRLNKDVTPYLYQLELVPILEAGQEVGEQWTVNGLAKIKITANKEVQNVKLHIKNIEIFDVKLALEGGDGTDLLRGAVTYQEEHDFLILPAHLLEGLKYSIEIKYKAYIQEELHGLYRSKYVDPTTGEEKWLATTQMEAINARELFPCFDEPSLKAVFEVKVGHQDKHTVLANAMSTGTEDMEGVAGWVWETFEPTPIMSTYLFALIVSEFTFTEALEFTPGLRVRSYAPKHYIDAGAGIYSANLGAHILDVFAKHFGQEYPLSKMDQAAVPDFLFGAMENFGLNIYRESALLIFESESTETERLSVSEVLNHELAHQWFGNLVTAAFWTHIWLNEGFARYVEYIGLAETNPEFDAWELFLVENFQSSLAFETDPAQIQHPLKIDEEEWVNREPMNWFDTITYQKGASLNKMMEGFLSYDVFMEGLKAYQAKMKFKGATQDDLFESLHEVATAAGKLPEGVTFKEIMDSWSLQTGYPLVTVETSADKITLKQSKYGEAATTLWKIPVSFTTAAAPDFDAFPEVWLLDKELVVDRDGKGWVLANTGSTGYYRVKYDANNEQLLEEQLLSDHEVIINLNRAQLLDDYFSFAWSKISTINRTLSLTKYLSAGTKTEKEYIVWRTLFKELGKTLNLFGSAGKLDDLKAYLLPGIKKAIVANGGFEIVRQLDDRGTIVLSQKLLMDWACALGEESCVQLSSELVEEWEWELTDPLGTKKNPIHKDYRPVVYCSALKQAENLLFDFIHSLYKSGGEDEGITTKQRATLLNALACTGEQALISRLLDGTLEDGFYVVKSHGLTILRQLAGNVQARKALVEFINNKYQELVAFYGGSSPIVQTVQALSNYMSTQEELDEIEQLVSSHAEIGDALDGFVATIEANIQWIGDFGENMQAFFKENSQQPDPSSTTEEITTTSEPTTTSAPTTEPPTTTTTMEPTTITTTTTTTEIPTTTTTTGSTTTTTTGSTTTTTTTTETPTTTSTTTTTTHSPTTDDGSIPTDETTVETTTAGGLSVRVQFGVFMFTIVSLLLQ